MCAILMERHTFTECSTSSSFSSMLLELQESDMNVVSVSSLTCTEECRIHVKMVASPSPARN